jgi:uncharacterized protein YcbX
MHISGLYHYPIKSCQGIALERAEVDARGIVDDRRLMLVDPAGRFLTQREHPRMALIAARVDGPLLSVSAPGMDSLALDRTADGPRREVSIWRDRCQAVDLGAEAAGWLSEFLATPCQLVRIAEDELRVVDQAYAPRPADQVGFADGFPFLVIAQASLDDLNARLETPLPMDRFRPNIVVAGCAPYAEDGWEQIRIGEITLALVKPCARCAITTTDQRTAERGKEPLRTLATYRAVGGKVMFGQNAIHDRAGAIRIGAEVELIA